MQLEKKLGLQTTSHGSNLAAWRGKRCCWILWFNGALVCFNWSLGSSLSLRRKHVLNQPLTAEGTYCDCRWKAEPLKRSVLLHYSLSWRFLYWSSVFASSSCNLKCVAVYFLCDTQQSAGSDCLIDQCVKNLSLIR